MCKELRTIRGLYATSSPLETIFLAFLGGSAGILIGTVCLVFLEGADSRGRGRRSETAQGVIPAEGGTWRLDVAFENITAGARANV